jgi:hypothetical protein
MKRVLCTIAVITLALIGHRAVAEQLPIFDTHVHYSENSWVLFSVPTIIGALRRAGVTRALVSSTPDTGTLKLHQAAPDLVVPELRPYHGDVRSTNWSRHVGTPGYLSERLDRNLYRGIGEFHLFDDEDAKTDVMQSVIALAVEHEILLHVHSDAASVRALFEVEPQLRVLWAHAGFFEPPDVVRKMLGSYDGLWAEVSFRAGEISGGSTIDPAWKALFLKYPDRFMIGSDTYAPHRWAEYPSLIRAHRQWLEQLPPDLAKAIAFDNAVKVLGVGVR